jgi:hypothetical protein
MNQTAGISQERFERLFDRCRRLLRSLGERNHLPIQDWEDVEQEMALALVQCYAERDEACLARAMGAAVDWMRKEYGLRVLHPMITVPDLTSVIDNEGCVRVWV